MLLLAMFDLCCTSHRECKATKRGLRARWGEKEKNKKKTPPPPSKGGGVKIFTLNQKDWLSVAEVLWLGLKGLIYTMYK